MLSAACPRTPGVAAGADAGPDAGGMIAPGGCPDFTVAAGHTVTKITGALRLCGMLTTQGTLYMSTLPESGSALLSVNPCSMVNDATNLYWSDFAFNYVLQVPLAGGSPVVTLASMRGRPLYVAVQGSTVYWSTTAGDPNAIAGDIESTQIGGGTLSTVVEPVQFPEPLVADGQQLLYGTQDPDTGSATITAFNLTTQQQSTLLSVDQPPNEIATDSDRIYWGDSAGEDAGCALRSLGKVNGVVQTLASDPSWREIAGVVVDSGNLYAEAIGMTGTGWILKLPPGGGAVETLVSGPIGGLLVDETSVYFSSECGVWRMTPK
jgi:hypothetical protein